jgi:hypothetical protein
MQTKSLNTAGPDDIEKLKFLTLPGLELWPLGRPASHYDCDIVLLLPYEKAINKIKADEVL